MYDRSAPEKSSPRRRGPAESERAIRQARRLFEEWAIVERRAVAARGVLVACTLTDTNLKTQRERWITLGENFGLGRTETADGLRLGFRGHPAVAAELQALVAMENECCSWATWSVERGEDGALVMAARSQGEGVATLHGMFTSAAPWRKA